ncbi:MULTISPECIES: hypothetical protein [Priestia]|uniref:hypothetical protein n=1 Tax=Priestia TaxID=2800373 RepID=UPI00070AC597|nr:MULTISPECIES: hypothetical protein [Priestia]KRD99151.1 hypothetical protein ASE46_12710 [Bacillus sp. Root239]MBE5098665.1 hypothetical protein [Priestia aryabhattai]MCM3545509.1 hypothetical protein [Priestia megaterium]MDI3093577.1 hypothetical protein [Priestia megaterium]MEC1069451.1 hypothetical protein [Priestia megaterium]
MANEKMQEGLDRFIKEDLNDLLGRLFPLMDRECAEEKRKLIETAVEYIYSSGYHQGAKDLIETHRKDDYKLLRQKSASTPPKN